MKWFLALMFVLIATSSRADIATSFTFANETTNCYTVVTQEGQPSQGAICPSGFFGGGGLQIWLGHDPSNGGASVTMYSCSATTLSDVVVPNVSEQRADSVTCTDVNYNYYTATWSGTLTYNYQFILRRVCTGGRGQTCRNRWVRAFSGGEGLLSTPDPPPPPPQPIITTETVTVKPAGCDASFVCALIPTEPSVLLGGQVGFLGWQLDLAYADGTTDSILLDTLTLSPVDEESDAYNGYGYGAIYVDGSWDPVKTFELNLDLVLDEDTGALAVTGGSLAITTITPP